MSTARVAIFRNYRFVVTPYEPCRKIHCKGNYLFYGTGQCVAFLLHIKPIKKVSTKETVRGYWYIRKRGTSEVFGSKAYTADIAPNRKAPYIKIITDVIEDSGKYAIYIGIDDSNGNQIGETCPFVFSVVDRVEFQTNITVSFIAVLALIISIIALIRG